MRHNPFEAKAYGGSYITDLSVKRKRYKKHKTILSEIKTIEENNEKL
tara:strand:- start:983 stop:1123 length:141 start_codon:yes stop_codon:yes gene_type:complete